MSVGWLELVLLALATNVDNLAVGAAYGARRRRLSHGQNGAIACANACATWVAMLAGGVLSSWVGSSAGAAMAALVYTVLCGAAGIDTLQARPRPLGSPGGAATLHFFRVAGEKAAMAGGDTRGVPWSEAAALAIALSASNLATGVAAGAADWPAGRLVLLMWIASVAGIAGGQLLGRGITSVVSIRYAGYCGSALFLVLAVRAWIDVLSA